MWDKKKIQAFFLFRCQICHKARRQLATLTMHLTQELLMNILCFGGSSAKEMRDFKMRSTVASHWNLTLTSEVDIDIGSWHQRWSSYSYMKSLTKSLTSNFLRSFGIWNKLGRWKAQYVGASSADQKFKKVSFWNVVFCYCMQQQTISQTDCDVWQKVDFIQQLIITSSVVGLRRSSKAFAKAKLAPKNVVFTVWWSATSLTHYSFLNPSENITSEKYAQ